MNSTDLRRHVEKRCSNGALIFSQWSRNLVRISKESTEVISKLTNSRFSAREKSRILAAADACTKQGELGALPLRKSRARIGKIVGAPVGLSQRALFCVSAMLR